MVLCPKPLLRRCPETGPEQGLAPNLYEPGDREIVVLLSSNQTRLQLINGLLLRIFISHLSNIYNKTMQLRLNQLL